MAEERQKPGEAKGFDRDRREEKNENIIQLKRDSRGIKKGENRAGG